MLFMKVRNWEKYQHYKKRNPPWIKLHFSMLSSQDWVALDDASRVLAVACMLIASRNEGCVPGDPAYIRRVAYLKRTPNFKPLIDCGFLEPASECKQMLAEFRPEERQRREETDSKRVVVRGLTTPLPKDFGVSERVAAWCAERGVENVERHLEYFVGYARANGKKYVDWDQAFMNAIRDDWAKAGDGRKRVAL